jgi:hypothetical protein
MAKVLGVSQVLVGYQPKKPPAPSPQDLDLTEPHPTTLINYWRRSIITFALAQLHLQKSNYLFQIPIIPRVEHHELQRIHFLQLFTNIHQKE